MIVIIPTITRKQKSSQLQAVYTNTKNNDNKNDDDSNNHILVTLEAAGTQAPAGTAAKASRRSSSKLQRVATASNAGTKHGW